MKKKKKKKEKGRKDVRNWRDKCKDRRQWNEILKQIKTDQGLYRRL
jgi:hypothetical protein